MRGTFKALLLGIAMAMMLASAKAQTQLTVIVFQACRTCRCSPRRRNVCSQSAALRST